MHLCPGKAAVKQGLTAILLAVTLADVRAECNHALSVFFEKAAEAKQ